MRLTSNKESVAHGEVSILAIVETLLAMALVFYLSSHFNTMRWLAVAMCFSPLLLLRTEESSKLGLEWYKLYGNWVGGVLGRMKPKRPGNIGVIKGLIFISLSYVAVNLGSFTIRIGATVWATLSVPGKALQAISKNWARVTLAMDSRFPPEWMPDHPTETFDTLIDGIRTMSGVARVFGVFLLVLFLPSILYRWSLKATSIVYWPLVFVVRSTFSEGADVKTKLELIKRSDLSRIRALYGVVAIIAFLVKLVLMIKWNGFVDACKGNPILDFLALYIAPAEIPKWQIATVINSALAVGGMIFAREALLRYDVGLPFPEKPVQRILGFVSGLRWMLALYSIICVGYITMREAQHLHWPALGTQWFPW